MISKYYVNSAQNLFLSPIDNSVSQTAILLIDWKVLSALILCYSCWYYGLKKSWLRASVADILLDGSFYNIFFIKSIPSLHKILKCSAAKFILHSVFFLITYLTYDPSNIDFLKNNIWKMTPIENISHV